MLKVSLVANRPLQSDADVWLAVHEVGDLPANAHVAVVHARLEPLVEVRCQ